ncbi:MAG: TetR/AcrR family transcriptional regulator [Candidatus Binatia bacterium]|jgi:AcrR family transcriptional regulator
MAASIERGTRERILEVAEAFLGERGYDGTRLHLIAQRVGIQKASLFHYFSSKEQLYRAVVQEGFGETEETIKRVLESEGTPLERICALIEAYVEMVAAHPERTKILLRQSLGDAPAGYQPLPDSEHLLGMVVKFVAEAQRARLFAEIDPMGAVLGVVGMVAFFFTSGPVLAPQWCGDTLSRADIDRIKRLVVQVVQRSLTAGLPAASVEQPAATAQSSV